MPRIKKKAKKERLSLELSAELKALLTDLRDRTQADSITEVIRRAVMVYDVLERKHKAGWIVMLKSGDRTQEIILA